MALLPRIFHDDPDPARHIANHSWSAALWFYARGQVTRAQVVSAFNLTVSDEVDLDLLIAHYTSLSASEQALFHSDLEAAGNLAERGLITKSLYMSFLGLS